MTDQSCSLENKKCVPCEGGTPRLRPKDYQPFLATLHGWNVRDEKSLQKSMTFKNFAEALSFLNRVSALAEDEGHHPDLNLHGWNKLDITLSTHAIGGLSENDFILAAKIDRL